MSLLKYAKDLQLKLDNANMKTMTIDSVKADEFIERDFMGD